MKKIALEIDCEEEKCGMCRFLEVADNGHQINSTVCPKSLKRYGYCIHFNKTVNRQRQEDDRAVCFYRLPECLNAEVKE